VVVAVLRGVVDTSVVIELFDRGNTVLLEDILNRYGGLYVPWIVLYEYLYGHKYLGRGVEKRKRAVEKLGQIVWVTQDILAKAMEIDVELHRKGEAIPFSDILVAATAITLKAELITLDRRHYTRIPELKMYVPKPSRKPQAKNK